MQSKRIPQEIIDTVKSWLRGRTAEVVVGGQRSDYMQLRNQVFQGTVWGPALWNLFYEDSNAAIVEAGFEEVKYADDLNAFKEFNAMVDDTKIMDAMDECQRNLHEWGEANQVVFDATKEGKRILSRSRSVGDPFTLLGIDFDCKLIMDKAIDALLGKCRWKLRMLIRSQRHFDAKNLVSLYKSRMLGYIEYRTAAIYHASDSLLAPVDEIQTRFLRHLGISEEEALMKFNLTPLCTRRDMAMLGLIHRTVIGKGCPHFKRFFREEENASRIRGGGLRHGRQLVEYRDGDASDFMCPNSRPAEYIARSALGLTSIYNMLPPDVVARSSVKEFQRGLQDMVKEAMTAGVGRWQWLLSPRGALWNHPLRRLREGG